MKRTRRSRGLLLALICMLAARARAAEPRQVGDWLVHGDGQVSVHDRSITIKAGDATPFALTAAVRKLDEPQQALALTATARHLGGRHRQMFLVAGSSDQPGDMVLVGPWAGIGRNAILQIAQMKHPPLDQWTPAMDSPLPAVDDDFNITLQLDLSQGQISAVTEGGKNISRPLKLPFKKIDLVGYAVRGQTDAVFGPLHVAIGAPAAAAAIEAAGKPSGRASAAKGMVREQAMDKVQDVAQAGWVDNVYKRPPTTLMLEKLGDGQVLSVDVPSRTDLFLEPPIAMRAGKVYRIDVEGRCVGQIEQIIAKLDNRKFSPIPWPVRQEWTTYSAQAKSSGGKYRFGVSLMGVGTFQIRSYRVTEMDAFDLPPAPVADRGELLPNGDFTLGRLDWNFRLPLTENGVVSPLVDPGQYFRLDPKTGHTALHLKAGERSLLASGTPLIFHFGKTYTLTVHGYAADGDADLFLVRPGMSAGDSERIVLQFKDGVAAVEFPMGLPTEGMIDAPQQQFAMRLRHMGNAEAQIDSISIREGKPDETAKPARAGVRIDVGKTGPAWVEAGQPVKVDLTTADLPADALQLTVSDERGEVIHRLPITLARTAEQRIGGQTEIHDLGPGWYRFGVAWPGHELTVISDDLAVVLPGDAKAPRNGFLGTHLGRLSEPSNLALLGELGIRHVRIWDLSWNRLQSAPDAPIAVPDDVLNAYHAAGIEPMAVLGSTPEWASSIPGKSASGGEYAKYPPKDMADWDNYVRQVVKACGDRVRYYEIWNEPNGHFLKVAPGLKKLEEVYAELVRRAYPIIKQENPNAVVVIGSCAGHPSFVINAMTKYDITQQCDAMSYHAYGGAPSAGQGISAFSYTQDYLHAKLKELNRPDLPIYDSESGLKHIEDGPHGAYEAMILAKGLVARQAAGFDRYYMYNSEPREFPGHYNFNMLLGYNARPLVTVPMIATWDRLLGDATFVTNLGDDAKGRHVYQFKRRDGRVIIAGWVSQGDAEVAFPQSLIAHAACVDALGRPIDGAREKELLLTGDLRYFAPSDLLGQLGLKGN